MQHVRRLTVLLALALATGCTWPALDAPAAMATPAIVTATRQPTAIATPTATPTATATPAPTPTRAGADGATSGRPAFGAVVTPAPLPRDAAAPDDWAQHTDGVSQLAFACPRDWLVDPEPRCFSPTGCVWVYPSDAAGIYLQPVAADSAGAPVEGRSSVAELAALLLHSSEVYQAAGAGTYDFVSAYVIQDATRKAYVVEAALNQDLASKGPAFYALDILVVPTTGRAIYMSYYHDGLAQLSAAQYRNLERFIWSLLAPEAQTGAWASS